MKLNICQELNCKNLESKDHVGTLCKKHAVDNDRDDNDYSHVRLKYKTTNQKNNVWENGIECVRSFPTTEILNRIKQDKKKRIQYTEMIKLVNEQIAIVDKRIEYSERTKNMRLSK